MLQRFGRGRIATLAVGALVAAGCGGGGGDAGGAGGGEEAAPAAQASPVDPATAGNVSGMVMFEGQAPAMAAIDMSDEPTCAQKYSTPPTEQTVLVSGGHLANVFVYVKEGLGALTFPVPSTATVIDQNGCRYVPHVSGVQVGQNLTFRNSDGLLHNINATPTENRGFNISQPVNMETSRTFNAPEVMIPIRCDVHGWMGAYVGVLSHPYHAVTGSGGTFALNTLPPGDYVIEAWHERYGTQTANVTVATGQTAQVSFTFNESMAANAVVPLGDPIDPHDHSVAPDRLGAGDQDR